LVRNECAAEGTGQGMGVGETEVPVLQTERLILRGMVREDFPDFAALWADEDVTSQVGVPVRGHGASWSAFLTNIGHWRMLGFGQWAVTDRATGAYLGQTGMFRAHRGYGAAFDDWPEAGWVLARGAQGRGLGAEAARAAHEWFDRVIGGPVVAVVSDDNAASRKLAAGLGYRAIVDGQTVEGAVLLRRETAR
jgi:RimJ/RimL family protein N-acetyltransferase